MEVLRHGNVFRFMTKSNEKKEKSGSGNSFQFGISYCLPGPVLVAIKIFP